VIKHTWDNSPNIYNTPWFPSLNGTGKLHEYLHYIFPVKHLLFSSKPHHSWEQPHRKFTANCPLEQKSWFMS